MLITVAVANHAIASGISRSLFHLEAVLKRDFSSISLPASIGVYRYASRLLGHGNLNMMRELTGGLSSGCVWATPGSCC